MHFDVYLSALTREERGSPQPTACLLKSTFRITIEKRKSMKDGEMIGTRAHQISRVVRLCGCYA